MFDVGVVVFGFAVEMGACLLTICGFAFELWLVTDADCSYVNSVGFSVYFICVLFVVIWFVTLEVACVDLF